VFGVTVSGYYNYHNAFETPLNNVSVKLMQGTTAIDSTITDANGYYFFPGICPGTYDVISTTVKPVGGINATDAVQANIWGVNPQPIERVQFIAGDVFVDGQVDGADASFILEYFVTNGNPLVWPSYEWSFWPAYDIVTGQISVAPGYVHPNPSIVVAGVPVVQNFYGLVTGDFNRSHTPNNAKSGSNVVLSNLNSVGVSEDAMDLHVTTVNALDASALSLVMNYPADKVEVMNVTMGGNAVMFNAINGELRIGWNSLNPIMLNAGDILVTLTVKALPAFTSGEQVTFVLAADPMIEIAGADYQPLTSAHLNIAVLESTIGVGIAPESSELGLSNYPNPFSHATTFTYSIPANGFVTMEIYDMVGKRVNVLINETKAAGTYTLNVSDAIPAAGIYMANLSVKTDEGVMTKSIRIVANK
jgi:hypothetical protein